MDIQMTPESVIRAYADEMVELEYERRRKFSVLNCVDKHQRSGDLMRVVADLVSRYPEPGDGPTSALVVKYGGYNRGIAAIINSYSAVSEYMCEHGADETPGENDFRVLSDYSLVIVANAARAKQWTKGPAAAHRFLSTGGRRFLSALSGRRWGCPPVLDRHLDKPLPDRVAVCTLKDYHHHGFHRFAWLRAFIEVSCSQVSVLAMSCWIVDLTPECIPIRMQSVGHAICFEKRPDIYERRHEWPDVVLPRRVVHKAPEITTVLCEPEPVTRLTAHIYGADHEMTRASRGHEGMPAERKPEQSRGCGFGCRANLTDDDEPLVWGRKDFDRNAFNDWYPNADCLTFSKFSSHNFEYLHRLRRLFEWEHCTGCGDRFLESSGFIQHRSCPERLCPLVFCTRCHARLSQCPYCRTTLCLGEPLGTTDRRRESVRLHIDGKIGGILNYALADLRFRSVGIDALDAQTMAFAMRELAPALGHFGLSPRRAWNRVVDVDKRDLVIKSKVLNTPEFKQVHQSLWPLPMKRSSFPSSPSLPTPRVAVEEGIRLDGVSTNTTVRSVSVTRFEAFRLVIREERRRRRSDSSSLESLSGSSMGPGSWSGSAGSVAPVDDVVVVCILPSACRVGDVKKALAEEKVRGVVTTRETYTNLCEHMSNGSRVCIMSFMRLSHAWIQRLVKEHTRRGRALCYYEFLTDPNLV